MANKKFGIQTVVQFFMDVRRRPPSFTIEDFILGSEDIFCQEARKYKRQGDYALDEEELVAEARACAVECYQRVAHGKCRSLDELRKYTRTAIQNRFIDIYRMRKNQQKTGEEDRLIFELSLDDLNSGRGGPDEEPLVYDPPVPFDWMAVAIRQTYEDLKGDNLACMIFSFSLGEFGGRGEFYTVEGQEVECSYDEEDQKDRRHCFESCMVSGCEGVLDVRAFSKRCHSRSITPERVSLALKQVRRTFYHNLPKEIIGDRPWLKSSLSRPHRRETVETSPVL